MSSNVGVVEIALRTLEVLVVDCQTTGATPGRARLLEVAWCRARAEGEEPPIHAELVAVPPEHEVPRRIWELTGLSRAALAHASAGPEVWRALAAEARSLAGEADAAPAVAHVSRFERGFLEVLQREAADPAPFPLRLLCTHELAIRALPGLPRRGLRALAGYFGALPAERRRAADHVRATLVVWRGLCAELERSHGVRTLAELERWLARTAPRRRSGREVPLPRAARLALPEGPGVYRLLNRRGALLYVGKASSLRRRVNSYYQKRGTGSERTAELLCQVAAVEVTETASVLEAALLEVRTIQREAPPYNHALREREEGLWFASPDLRELAPRPDARHPLGPLPAREPVLALGELASLLAERAPRPDPERCRRALALPPDLRQELPPSRFLAGLARFREAHADRLERAPGGTLARLLRLGAALWREARRARGAGEEPLALEPPAPGRLDPSRLGSAIEAAVLRGAHLIRRGAWLCELGEAVLTWSPHGDRVARVLVVSDGEPGAAGALAGGPAPCARFERPRLERLARLDRGKHDRLRVLSSELRRIALEERALELRLGVRRVLDGARLRRRLSWL
jgi:DNA polymerase III epsilon subunit-like protein